jgi:hypothetical protein
MIANPIARAEYARNKHRHAARRKAYYQKNKEQIKEKHRKYRLLHLEEYRQRSVRWYQKNKAHASAMGKIRYQKDREKIKQRSHDRYHNDPEARKKAAERQRRWRACPEGRQRRLAVEKAWRKSNPHIARSRWLKHSYGITIDDYNRMYSDQSGCCSICREPETRKDGWSGKVVTLAVDHCHSSGKVRALLCRRCNQVLGNMKERIDWLESMIAYILNPPSFTRQ